MYYVVIPSPRSSPKRLRTTSVAPRGQLCNSEIVSDKRAREQEQEREMLTIDVRSCHQLLECQIRHCSFGLNDEFTQVLFVGSLMKMMRKDTPQNVSDSRQKSHSCSRDGCNR